MGQRISLNRIDLAVSMRRLPVYLILFFLALPGLCQNPKAGTTGGSALRIGVGTRTAAMGNTFTGIADDVSSIYWNPAGLGQLERPQLSIMGANWLGGVRHGWIGFAQSLGRWLSVGGDVSYLWTGDILRTVESESDVGRYQEMGTFNYSDMVIRAAVGSGEYKGVRIGAAFQVSQQGINYSTTSPRQQVRWNHVNLGLIYRPPVKNLRLGLGIFNVGATEQSYLDQQISIPRSIRLGGSYTVTIDMPDTTSTTGDRSMPQLSQNYLTVGVDLDFRQDDSMQTHLGLEYVFNNGFAVRGGYRGRTDFEFLSNLSGGFGYATRAYQIDYAFVPFGEVGNAHRVSLSLDF